MWHEETDRQPCEHVLNKACIVKEWGGTFVQITFRYNLLTQNPTIRIHLGTAAMPPHHVDEFIPNIHLQANYTSLFQLSTDFPNIFLSVHKMEHPIGPYHDLTFVIISVFKNVETASLILFFWSFVASNGELRVLWR